MRSIRFVVAGLSIAVWMGGAASAVTQGDGPSNPCELRPFQTVDDGFGAEPGVVREFDSGLTVPSQCLIGGKTWVPRVGINLTRVAAGPSSITLQILGRRPMGGARAVEPPGDALLPPRTVTAQGLPVFPGSQYYEYDAIGPGGSVNNILWGNYFYIGGAFDGDTTGNSFLTADLQGPPGEIPCFTATGGGPPSDLCTNGEPNLNAVGIGAGTYTFYARYVTGLQVMGDQREGLPSTFHARYVAGGSPPGVGTTDLRLREGPGGPVICQFFDIPDDFSATCSLTAPQQDLLAAGGVFAEVTIGAAAPISVRLLPANLHVFADGFESGDTAEWTTTVQ